MANLLLVAHAPLASSLQAVAQHVYPDCRAQLRADVYKRQLSSTFCSNDSTSDRTRALLRLIVSSFGPAPQD